MKTKHVKTYSQFLESKNNNDSEHIDESKLGEIARNLYKKGTDFTKSVIQGAKREGKETVQAVEILRKMIKGEDVSDKEIKFFKAQSVDLFKVLPLIAIQAIPVPIPITPLLIVLGKKYGFSVLPNSHEKIKLDEE
jgi:hypothetical protein